jgi:hypothetical protein
LSRENILGQVGKKCLFFVDGKPSKVNRFNTVLNYIQFREPVEAAPRPSAPPMAAVGVSHTCQITTPGSIIDGASSDIAGISPGELRPAIRKLPEVFNSHCPENQPSRQ